MNLGGWLIWVSLVECLDYIGCIGKVFRWLPTHHIGSVVKSFPLHKIQQARPFVMTIDPAVQDPVDFPLVGVLQLNWWWRFYGPVRNPTRASGLQQRHMEDRVNA